MSAQTFVKRTTGANVTSATAQELADTLVSTSITSLMLVTPALGTPVSGVLTSCTGLPIATGVANLGTGMATFLTTPSSANLAAALTDETGSGVAVFATSPTLTTPVLGVASATSVNKVAITTPASNATLTIANGKTLTASNSLTLAGTDSTTMTFPSTSATIARTDAANTFTGHQTIEGVTSTGATGTGQFVFDTSPTLTTPVLGVASATTVNKVTLTTPATGSTLTILNGKTLTANKSITLEGTDSTTMTFPSTSATIARTDAANTFTGHQTIEGITSTGATGTGNLVFATSPTFTTPLLGTPTSGNLSNCTALNGSAISTGTVPPSNLGSGSSISTKFLRGDSTWQTVSGAGTVTNTGGSLTSNAIVLGAGASDTKVSTMLLSDGGGGILLGTANSSGGSITFYNDSSVHTVLMVPTTTTVDYQFRLPPDPGTNNYVLGTNGSGQNTYVDGSNIPNLNAANLTGNLPAIDGSALMNLPSSTFSGTGTLGNGNGTYTFSTNSGVNAVTANYNSSGLAGTIGQLIITSNGGGSWTITSSVGALDTSQIFWIGR